MSLLANSNAVEVGGYTINNSLRIRRSASAYLSRSPSSSGSQTTWTWSGWVKRGLFAANETIFAEYNANNNSGYTTFYFGSDDKLKFTNFYTNVKITTQVFRDPSAWYHLVIALDTTQSTSTNRLKLYVNGTQITAFDSSSDPALNDTFSLNNTGTHYLGFDGLNSSGYFDGYLAEVHFINNQQLTPSSFGQTDPVTGVWQAKKYTGTYGTNGYYLKFADASAATAAAIGKDSSGNGNNWTPNNISVTAGTTYDAMIDSPTLGTTGTQPIGNYPVLNPVNPVIGGWTISNCNTQFSFNATIPNNDSVSTCTMKLPSSGKFYCEGAYLSGASAAGSGFAVGSADGIVGGPYYTSSTLNDIIGVAADIDNSTVYFYKNNSLVQTSTGIDFTTQNFFCVRGANGTTARNWSGWMNFGQRPFTYTPPSGYKALCTTNLPDSTILQGNKYMDATLYTGTGASQSITNAGSFKPDFVWTKSRSSGTLFNNLMDSVRGTNKDLYSNSTVAEETNANIYTAINSNGFSVGTDNSANQSGQTFVGWQWQAGQGTTSSNTNGSITSTVSVNATAGFSIVTYTGTGANATVGHGLGVAPKMVIVKSRSAITNWAVWHTSIANTQFLWLNSTNAVATDSTYWNSASPTSTVINIGVNGNTNDTTPGRTFVAYCFAEISGFSKFGSYTGNGSADGPFCYTGFLPKFVLLKNYSTGGSWVIHDTARDTYNVTNKTLYPNYSNAESTPDAPFDILSNGFKLRSATLNDSGAGFIFMAFASNPFKNSNAF